MIASTRYRPALDHPGDRRRHVGRVFGIGLLCGEDPQQIMHLVPPHIAQVAGHRDINITMGYKAVYPDEAIHAHLAFLARRRALRQARSTASPPTSNGKNSSATSS